MDQQQPRDYFACTTRIFHREVKSKHLPFVWDLFLLRYCLPVLMACMGLSLIWTFRRVRLSYWTPGRCSNMTAQAEPDCHQLKYWTQIEIVQLHKTVITLHSDGVPLGSQVRAAGRPRVSSEIQVSQRVWSQHCPGRRAGASTKEEGRAHTLSSAAQVEISPLGTVPLASSSSKLSDLSSACPAICSIFKSLQVCLFYGWWVSSAWDLNPSS